MARKRGAQAAAVRIQLHTGRTHQIRVHFEAIGCSLLGDEMYHGKMDQGIERQALHCMELIFTHPFTKRNGSSDFSTSGGYEKCR